MSMIFLASDMARLPNLVVAASATLTVWLQLAKLIGLPLQWSSQ